MSPFFPENAGYIYRAAKWAEILRVNRFDVDIKNTLPEQQYTKYFERKEVRFHLIALFKRTWHVLTSYKYDSVIVRRELLLYNDYGNLFLEKALLRIHPSAILDFDDNISAAKGEPREVKTAFGKLMLENGTKFFDSLKLYRRFIVGSGYLKTLVMETNANAREKDICVIPTCVDYENHTQKKYDDQDKSPIVLGWIGSNGNLPLLEGIIPQIDEVNEEFPIKLIIISGKEIYHDVGFEIENRKWSYESQINDLRDIDIGLMPLNDTPGERGKCGFKLIQYMGLGIVSVASAIAVNKEIVEDGIDGYLVEPDGDWRRKLSKTLNSQDDFEEIGNAAREKIKERYSFKAHTDKYIEFISG